MARSAARGKYESMLCRARFRTSVPSLQNKPAAQAPHRHSHTWRTTLHIKRTHGVGASCSWAKSHCSRRPTGHAHFLNTRKKTTMHTRILEGSCATARKFTPAAEITPHNHLRPDARGAISRRSSFWRRASATKRNSLARTSGACSAASPAQRRDTTGIASQRNRFTLAHNYGANSMLPKNNFL